MNKLKQHLNEMHTKLNALDKRIKATLVILIILSLGFGIGDLFLDNGDDGNNFQNNNFSSTEQNSSFNEHNDGDGGRFGGDGDGGGDGGGFGGKEGATKDLTASAIQLGFIAFALFLILIFFKPKAIKATKQSILLGKKGNGEDKYD